MRFCFPINNSIFITYRNSSTKSICRFSFTSTTLNTMETPTKIKLSERLPSYIRPVHYKLSLRPDLKTGLFEGTVKIDVNVKQNKDCINIHTKFLNLTSVKVFKGKEELTISKYLEIKQTEQLLINFDKAIDSGNYQLEIDFNGDLTKSFVGFYLSRLNDERTMVASKFQPTYARQAFPCFDEPDFKATYDITIVKPVSYVALSNMNEISSVKNKSGEFEEVSFATSVPMSTYLVCFVVCDFDFKSDEINSHGIGNNFTLRSYAQKDQMHKIDFAQSIGRRATEFYIQYYEVPFPLPKLDMIAIPDYVSGATEHWGLITYRETSFLVDDATASSKNKISVANTIAHELAHMWFGNLVTLKWWDDLWLNEGFASYMQFKALNAIEPSWKMLDQFLTKTLHSVLGIDAKLSSHPIVQTVSTPDQITAIFDAISYNKGSSVLRMLEGFIGEENFRRGVSDYLKKYEFSNTVTKDLLNCLEPYFKQDHPDFNLSYIMDTWTRQMGYPLVSVTKGETPNTYQITQKRFLLDPEAVSPNDSEYSYRWFIPITCKTKHGACNDILWFSNTEDKVTLTLQEDHEWLKINNNQVGYYRVNYERDMWHNLIQQLKNKSVQLTISDRSHLLDDVFALADAAAVPYELALNLSTYLTVEEDYVPWETAKNLFTILSVRLINTTGHEKLEKYIQRLVQPMYEKMSWQKSDIGTIESLLRTNILAIAVSFRVPEAESKVKAMFLEWLNSTGSKNVQLIEPDLRDFVYYHGMKSATESEWDKLWEIYLKEEDVQELDKLRTALAAPRDTGLLQKYLILAWDEKNIRSQDYLSLLHRLSANPRGAELVWSHVRSSWPALVGRFSLNSRYLGNLIPAITAAFKTEDKLKEMEAFFAQYPDAGAGEAARRRALETVRNNIKWAKANQATVETWLDAQLAK